MSRRTGGHWDSPSDCSWFSSCLGRSGTASNGSSCKSETPAKTFGTTPNRHKFQEIVKQINLYGNHFTSTFLGGQQPAYPGYSAAVAAVHPRPAARGRHLQPIHGQTQERQATERPDQKPDTGQGGRPAQSAARERQLALHPLSARPADQPGQPGLRRLPDLEFRERRREGRDPVQTSHQDRPRTGSDRHADRHEPGARGTLDGRHRRYVLQYAGRIRHDGRGPRDQRRGPGIPAIQAALVCQGCQ